MDGSDSPWEETHVNVTRTTSKTKSCVEPYSLRTVPVCIKRNGRKINVNVVLDDLSNGTFTNEQLAEDLGLH